MTDQKVSTIVNTEDGELAFQEYFVHRRCQPKVSGFCFEGAGRARPAPGVLEALGSADVVVICPSNPWVSIDPILAVPGVKPALGVRFVIAVSPIIGGQTVKGPAAKMYAEMGIEPSALAVARHYHSLLNAFVLDQVDASQAAVVDQQGVPVLTTQTLMISADDRRRLAKEVLEFTLKIREEKPSERRNSI
jgi:LPPG:FO 2-phospho-L-lactate transferase